MAVIHASGIEAHCSLSSLVLCFEGLVEGELGEEGLEDLVGFGLLEMVSGILFCFANVSGCEGGK